MDIKLQVSIATSEGVYLVALDKELRLWAVNCIKQTIHRLELTEGLLSDLREDLSLESDQRAFFELLRNSLLQKDFAVDHLDDRSIQLLIKYRLGPGLVLKGPLKVPLLAEASGKKGNAYAEQLGILLASFFPGPMEAAQTWQPCPVTKFPSDLQRTPGPKDKEFPMKMRRPGGLIIPGSAHKPATGAKLNFNGNLIEDSTHKR